MRRKRGEEGKENVLEIPKKCIEAYNTLTSFFYASMLDGAKSRVHLLGWASEQTQIIRFRILLEEAKKHFEIHNTFSVFDAGCGFGRLYEYMQKQGLSWRYTGVDMLEPCIAEAVKHYRVKTDDANETDGSPKFFFGDIFDATKQWGRYDVSLLSGMLNLNIETMVHEGANYELVLYMAKRLLSFSTQGCVCNLLHEDSPSQDATFFYYSPKKLQSLLEHNGIRVIAIRRGYLPNDMTFVMKNESTEPKLSDTPLRSEEYRSNKKNSYQRIEVYTDGGCRGNPGTGAWAFVCPKMSIHQSGSEPHTTNTRMELLAAIKAIRWILAFSVHDYDEVSVYTDSQYLRNGITVWIERWKQKGWKTSTKKPVKNRDLWEKLVELKTQCEKNNCTLSWNWVQGHKGDTYNELCDDLVRKQLKVIE